MARQKAIYRKLKIQRRYAVDEIRLRELTKAARERAALIQGNPMEALFGSTEATEDRRDRTAWKAHELFERQIKDLMGVSPDKLASKENTRRRLFLGLEGELESSDAALSLQTPRDLVMQKVADILERTHLIFRAGNRAMYLIRTKTGFWYFLYRVEGRYYEKSVKYDSRTKAMDRLESNRISWIEFFTE